MRDDERVRAQARGDRTLAALGWVSLGERECCWGNGAEEFVVSGSRRDGRRPGYQEHAIDGRERRHHLAALAGGDHGTSGSLAGACSLVVLDADHQAAARRTSHLQELEMADMEQVEDTRRHHGAGPSL